MPDIIKKIIAGSIILLLISFVVIITDGGGIADLGAIGAVIFLAIVGFIWKTITRKPEKRKDDYYPNGNLKNKVNDQGNLVESYYPDGTLKYEVIFSDHNKTHKYYYKNGQLKSESIINKEGKRVGKFRRWDEEGNELEGE